METSLKTGFAQIFSWGPYAYESNRRLVFQLEIIQIPHQQQFNG